VSDRENNRIQVFTTAGEFVAMWTPVNHPNKIQFDGDGLLHIIGGSGVEVRKPDGTVVGSWADWGDGPGQFVRGPHGCWLDTDGTMYTAEAGFRNRLQKFVRV
jgi:hypothetical protein